MQPDIKPPPKAPPPPSLNEARLRAEELDRMRLRQGRAATFLSTAADRAGGGVARRMLAG